MKATGADLFEAEMAAMRFKQEIVAGMEPMACNSGTDDGRTAQIMNNELTQMLSFWGVVPKDIVSNVGTIWFTDAKTGKQHFITMGDCEVDYKSGVEQVS
jgi:hypothetical protein